MSKILIDANPIVPYYAVGRIAGIGRTCMELIKELDNRRGCLPFEIELFTQNLKGVSARNLNTGFKCHHLYFRNTEFWLEWSRRLHLRELMSGYDLQHITHNYEIVRNPSRCIVTIHDVMFITYPEKFLDHDNARRLYPPFARKAKHVITISENSKREIMEHMDIPEERITVTPWGVDHNLLYPHAVGANRWCGNEPYFTSVSCDRGRKNTITVMRAFERFCKQNPQHHLILVWRNPTEEAINLASKMKGKVHFASNLTNEELADIYAGATASFFPSLYEGFGLPIAESMACGTPCITCRNSSLEEVGGDAALYIDPMDVDAMASIMEAFENDSYDMADLRERSIAQASNFTWQRCADQTIEVYKKCLGL